MRNLKVLGFALVAALAMSASAASASEFEAEGYPVELVGEAVAGAENVFEVGGVKVTCSDSTFSGAMSETSSTVEVGLDYTGCQTSLGTNATVDSNGCFYRFHSGAESSKDIFNATVDLVCPEGKNLVITMGLCTVHLTPTFNLSVTATVIKIFGIPYDIDFDKTIGIVSHVTNVFLCPISTSSTETKLKFRVTMRAKLGAPYVTFRIKP